jgi:hypothetical protein
MLVAAKVPAAEAGMRSLRSPFEVLRGGISAAVVVCCLWHAGGAWSQEVYKSVDADGHVVYSDRGNSKNAPKTSVRVDEGDPAEAARLAREQQALKTADSARRKEQQADEKAQAASEKKRQESCRNARNEYDRLMNRRAIYKIGADGERVYYSDEEADALREQARKAMTAACGS